MSSCVQMFACESGQRVNFDGRVNFSDLFLSGESGTAVEMEHIQPKGRETWKQQTTVSVIMLQSEVVTQLDVWF